MMKRPDVDFIESPLLHVFSQAKVFSFLFIFHLRTQRYSTCVCCTIRIFLQNTVLSP